MKMKRFLALMLLMMMILPAMAEEDDWSFIEISGEPIIAYNNVEWNFPIDMMDMDPALVRLVNKSMFLPKDFTPADLKDVKKLKLDKDGNNTSGGIRMVDSSWQLQKDCLAALVQLADAAGMAGHELYLKSGYRSY